MDVPSTRGELSLTNGAPQATFEVRLDQTMIVYIGQWKWW